MFQFPASQYVLLGTGTDLAVRAGADAQVVAEAPVVQVVRTLPAGARIGADLVLAKAGLCQQGLAVFLHVPGVVLIGNALRRPCEEHRVRFQGQLVVRDVRRLQCEGAFKIGLGAGQGLFRQRVHQVDVEIVVARVLRHLHRALGLATVVDAAQALEHRVVETLDAEAEAVHAGRAVAVEAAVFGGARVGFQGDLGIGREAQARAGLLQEAVDRFRREQAGRAATDEDGHDLAAPDRRQRLFQVAAQRIQIGAFGDVARRGVGIEVAIRAFAHAPGHVHIDGQRRQAGQRGARRHEPARGRCAQVVADRDSDGHAVSWSGRGARALKLGSACSAVRAARGRGG
ncbi:hypothetical protein G6F31_014561 [Rhizopus arrhizus]|nr:hypothetical protein G6F31_014561 [Rhizopus arrhizus]